MPEKCIYAYSIAYPFLSIVGYAFFFVWLLLSKDMRLYERMERTGSEKEVGNQI